MIRREHFALTIRIVPVMRILVISLRHRGPRVVGPYGNGFIAVWHLYASAHAATGEPFLAESVDDARQVFSEHFAQLAFDFLLQVSTNDLDTVKGTAHIDILKRVVLEDESDPFRLADDQDENCAQIEQREFERHRNQERLGGEQRSAHRQRMVRVKMRIMGQRIRLDPASDFEPCVALVAKLEDPSKAVEGEVSDLQKSESRRLHTNSAKESDWLLARTIFPMDNSTTSIFP